MVGGSLPPQKTGRHDIAEILLKVALNTINQIKYLVNLKKNQQSLCIHTDYLQYGVRVMVFNTTFNNISVISWWSVVLVEET